MIEAEKMTCDFFVMFPCDCKSHYESKTFKDGDAFLRFVEDAVVHFRTDNVTDKFPLVAGISRGEKLGCQFVYSFSAIAPRATPTKMKWIGEGTMHAIHSKLAKEKEIMLFVVDKDVKVVRSKDLGKFLGRCSDIVNAMHH